MPRAILIVLDSVGCGAAPDASDYGDATADTLGHIAEVCAQGGGDRAGLRAGPLRLPHLSAMGLAGASRLATGRHPPGLDAPPADASFGIAVERSPGKDTPSGHWEIAGTPVPRPWGYFPHTVPCFPAALIDALVIEGDLPGILGDRHDSGTAIIAALGEEHVRTGRPILYTSADSVLQIAAHEESFGLERLYDLCRIVRRLCDPLGIGRVIARPFAGSDASSFRRTGKRRDYAVPPPPGTLFDRVAGAGRSTISIGKTADIFAHVATGVERKGRSNAENVDYIIAALDDLADGGLVFANLVDFDSEFGHRRDVPGYAACLERFDAALPRIHAKLRPEDLLVITADHGNDPTAPGTDHTREVVPVLARCDQHGVMAIGRRSSFADIGATLARHLGIAAPASGSSWLAA